MYASTKQQHHPYLWRKQSLSSCIRHFTITITQLAAGGDNSNFQNSIISRPSCVSIIEALIGNFLQFKDSNLRKRQHILARRKAMPLYAKT